ncbi:MAG: substrate-binding periplasmic protein [Actinomycetota bacterium]
MTRFAAALLVVLALAVGLAAEARAAGPNDTVVIAVPGNIFGRTDRGQPQGIIAEAVAEVFRRMGRPVQFLTMRQPEAIAALKDGRIDVATVVVKTPKIQDAGLFSNPIVMEYNAVVVRKGEGFPLKATADLAGRRIGVRAGYSYPLLQKNKGVETTAFDSDGAMFRALVLGKLDAAIFAALSDSYTFRSEGIITKVELLDTAVGSVPLYAVLSPRLFSNAELQEFNRRLAELRQSPAWPDILERNGFADLVHEWPLVSE